jgi:hypothetical protein
MLPASVLRNLQALPRNRPRAPSGAVSLSVLRPRYSLRLPVEFMLCLAGWFARRKSLSWPAHSENPRGSLDCQQRVGASLHLGVGFGRRPFAASNRRTNLNGVSAAERIMPKFERERLKPWARIGR